MSLNKVKRDLKKLKTDMEIDVEPTHITFYHWCEKHYYHRRVHIGEILFTSYKVDGKEVKSNPLMFLKLSHKYFTDIYNVPNPIKDGKPYSWKLVMSDRWRILHREQFKGFRLKDVQYDDEFSDWFEQAWQQMIYDDNVSMFNQLIKDSKEIEEIELKEFEKRLKGNTGTYD